MKGNLKKKKTIFRISETIVYQSTVLKNVQHGIDGVTLQ